MDTAETVNNQIDSFAARVLALEVGETESKTCRLDGNEATKEVMAATLTKLRNSVAAAVSRASSKTGHVFITETGDIRTKSYDFLMTVAVTRKA
ncbi:hypothetical protein Nazgul13 [Burkholderia phage BcepNazgul]|uniref:DUF7609 domain-containing protein n=1 Tax=Burkholderia phage BcepNazgul TaxID=242861 RepID=Q6UYF2_9CAUD|nr:hypothetical protein Nazgul13 [Burkholderia phage BcepNazgul]AAQ63389.1 hypothetical protein Nazgul13 [Burkholderia phage BcepNazgul]